MLKRRNAALYEETAGNRIELAVKATGNNGTEDARFDYDSAVLDRETVQGRPGCHIDVASGIRQFRVLVTFLAGAPQTARYDLFQANAAGTLMPVGKSVTNAAGTSLIGFGIDGVAAPKARRKGVKRAAKRKTKRAASRKSTTVKRTSRKAASTRRRTRKTAKKSSRKRR